MTGLNEGAPWQPGSGSLCSGENAGFVSFPIVEYLKGPEPESGHASRSHGPCLVEVLGRSAQEGCHEGFAMSSGCRDLPPKIWTRRNPQPRASRHRPSGKCPS